VAATVYHWPPETVDVPAFIVGYPEAIDLTTTFQRGSDELQLPCWYVLGAANSSTSDVRDALSAALGPPPSLSESIEAVFATFATNIGRANITRINFNGVDYIGLKWLLDVVTSGAMNLSAIMDAIGNAVAAAGL
jgi:hypothetical protein